MESVSNIILPENLCKYVGTITKILNSNSEVRYQLRIRNSGVNVSRTFKTRNEAVEYMKKINVENGLVKNLIHDCGDYYEVELTQGKRAKFDKDDLAIVDNFIWSTYKCRKTFYVQARDLNSRKHVSLHRLILENNNLNLTIDHINRDGLDNRKANLRLADQRTQSINRTIMIDNNSGYTGICFNRNRWRSSYTDETGKRIYKYFPVKEYGSDTLAKIEAIKWRQQKEKEIKHYQEALNSSKKGIDYSDLIDDLDLEN